LAQIIVILVAARVTGALVRRLGKPQVVGEMLAGIALGPSLLGASARPSRPRFSARTVSGSSMR
jgi:Kef-type K+ transport system membrane component KefB